MLQKVLLIREKMATFDFIKLPFIVRHFKEKKKDKSHTGRGYLRCIITKIGLNIKVIGRAFPNP